MGHQITPAADRPSLADALADRILTLDGAMGTMVQNADPSPAAFGGEAYEGCNEQLVLTAPDIIEDIHEAYLEAGADVVETDTFGATPLVLAEYDLEDKCREINRRAVEIARQAADKHTTAEKPRFVLGSVGPTTKTLSVTGGVTFDELVDHYTEQILGLLSAGEDAPLLDGILLETTQDTRNLKAASLGLRNAEEELGRSVPVLISCTIEPMGTMLAGQSVEAFWASIEHLDPLTVGLNCATGPEFMADHIRTLADLATCYVTVYPNAGLPDVDGNYDETPTTFDAKLTRFLEEGWVNMVGGCCGTTPEHIQVLSDAVESYEPRTPREDALPLISGIEAHEIDPENRPILVGERTNVIGSRKFKRLIQEGEYELAAEVGRAQVDKGAQVVDVCVADPDRDELEDMERVLEHLVNKVKVPLMIDSTEADVIELALRYSQGKAIVNSINLEDGEERFDAICPLLKRYGAATVVGCIDEDPDQGMAITRERKLAIAERSYELLTEKHGIPPRNIIFDPLVFPCGTGDETYIGSAEETIEGVRAITERYPECSTVLGISNVSFGLPPAGREVLNSVFLHHCIQAGLTFAIVNTEGLERYASIPDEEKELADDLLFHRREDALERFTEHFRDAERRVTTKDDKASLPLDERLPLYIVEGTKDGLAEDLDEALEAYEDPLDIINGPLMEGMDEVGQLFNDNELIVAEVLQSAEAMKAAVAHLEPHMDQVDTNTKARILLATVKGDVHDIGKNLVEIILENNGFDVVNLGIKVPPEELIQACREHEPDAIGLSGLLVKSAKQMVVTAEDLRESGVDVPLFVGGAALSDTFTRTRIGPAYEQPTLYARDAMNGLELANTLFDSDETVQRKTLEAAIHRKTNGQTTNGSSGSSKEDEHVPLDPVDPLPVPPDLDLHVLEDIDPFAVYPYINPRMLYAKHLGLKGDPDTLVEQRDQKALELTTIVENLKREAVEEGWIVPRGVYRFFPVSAEGETLILHDPDAPADEIARFTFQRQPTKPRRCLTDYVTDPEEHDVEGQMDTVALFAVSAGQNIRETAKQLKADGQYLKSHALQALALETAEAFAERLHQRIREHWGITDDPTWDKWDLFKTRYRGCRYSFGYPACPDLEQQATLWELIEPDEHIGVELTDGYMMDPEASVSALVFHHPDARYFNVESG